MNNIRNGQNLSEYNDKNCEYKINEKHEWINSLKDVYTSEYVEMLYQTMQWPYIMCDIHQ